MSYRGGGGGGGGIPPIKEGQVYIGNLPPDIKTRDIEDIFFKFGKINFINLKNQQGPAYAFVEFDDPRDADDAIRERDGYCFDGYTLRVELPHGLTGGRPRDRGNSWRDSGRPSYGGSSRGSYDRNGSGGRGDYRGGDSGRGSRRDSPVSRRSDNRVALTGLPKSTTKQDLKDYFRDAGDVCYVEVLVDGAGAVEFVRYDDMKYAVKKLDDTKFKTKEGEISYIRVKEDYCGGRGETTSATRDRSRSPRRRSGSPPPRRR